MIILGIETSCDETAASVVEGKGGGVRVLSNVVSSQIEIHQKYHGVVPEIAAREHVLNILPVINEALEKAGIFLTTPGPSLKRRGGLKIDAIAVTVGPGLITSLIVGVETAKTLSCVWNLPVVAVNHIEGHVRGNFITSPQSSSCKREGDSEPPPNPSFGRRGDLEPPPKSSFGRRGDFPAVVLTVSGGHTMLVLMDAKGKMKIIGDTRDDAAGEAFDKAAKLLGLGYPGGPAVSKMAAEYKETHPASPAAIGNPPRLRGAATPPGEGNISLPRPMLNDPNFDFSFSGLKTALLYKIQKDKEWKERIPEYCHEFQCAVVETLVGKAVRAAKKYEAKTLMLAGGVAANLVLREEFQNAAAKLGVACQIPPLAYTTDNAAMIAAAGYFRAKKKDFTPWQKLKADCNKKL